MGNYYFVYNFYEHRGEPIKPERKGSQVRASEEFFDEPLATRIHGKGSCGIWFYETALWNPRVLKEKLIELTNDVDRLYDEYIRQLPKGFKVGTSY